MEFNPSFDFLTNVDQPGLAEFDATRATAFKRGYVPHPFQGLLHLGIERHCDNETSDPYNDARQHRLKPPKSINVRYTIRRLDCTTLYAKLCMRLDSSEVFLKK